MRSHETASPSIYMVRVLLAAFIAACTISIACVPEEQEEPVTFSPGTCSESAIPLRSGSYEFRTNGEALYEYGEEGASRPVTEFPHASLENSLIEYDREAARVVVRYERGDQQVVETWRVTGYTEVRLER